MPHYILLFGLESSQCTTFSFSNKDITLYRVFSTGICHISQTHEMLRYIYRTTLFHQTVWVHSFFFNSDHTPNDLYPFKTPKEEDSSLFLTIGKASMPQDRTTLPIITIFTMFSICELNSQLKRR